MKKLAALIILLLVLNTMLLCIQNSVATTKTTNNIVFKENFESYPLGRFESTENWNLEVGLTEDPENQSIVNSVRVSPTKSLQMWSYYEGIRLERDITTTGNYITYQIYVMMAEVWEGSVSIGFANRKNQIGFSGIKIWADRIDAVAYDESFGMRNNIELQRYTKAMKWYNITVGTNKNTYEFSV